MTYIRCPLDPEKIQVKRVIGLEWDVIDARPPYPERLVRVPQGHIWVEGDAKETDKTLDSNTYGPISKQLVTGQISHILLPLRKAGAVRWWEYRDDGAGSTR
jgi:mitochondrial inner membrane protease subunit 2